VSNGVALSLRSITKTFPGVHALRDVSIDFASGHVTALLGQNGSGKSTLVKILAGFYSPDPGGAASIAGVPLPLPVDAAVAHERGLRFVHQDLALVSRLSVATNIALAQGFAARGVVRPISGRRHRARARAALSRLGVDVDPGAEVSSLSSTDRMLVAIARGLDAEAKPGETIIVLDEPTAYLPANAVNKVLELLSVLRAHGGTIIYVTHRLDEVARIADDVVVLRDGHLVGQQPMGSLGKREIAEMIVGGAPPNSETVASVPSTGPAVLEATGLIGLRVADVSLKVNEREIVGVAGLIGCGRSELLRLIAGAQPYGAGQMVLDGERYCPKTPRAALARGVAYVPPDRHGGAIVDGMSVRANVTLGNLRPYWSKVALNSRAERADVARLLDRFDIRPRNTEQSISKLSGGNQQKAVLAKVVRLEPRLLVVDEPTQGVDVGGKRDIIDVLRGFARGGGAVLIGSSDFDEVATLCDRVLVLDRGRVIGQFDRGTLDERRIGILVADTDSAIASRERNL
jgi:ribose transport system ATP-binding protein